MTRWLHTVRATGLLLALGAGAATVPCGAGASYGAEWVRGVERGAEGRSDETVSRVRSSEAGPVTPGGGRTTPGTQIAQPPPGTPGGATAPVGRGGGNPPPIRDNGTAPGAPGSKATPGGRVTPSAQAVHGGRSEARVKTAASPSAAEPSRAGSRAGEGRERPGRQEAARTGEEDQGPAEDADTGAEPDSETDGAADVVPEPSRDASPPVASAPPLQPAQQAVARAQRPAEPVLRILPLGSGMVLIGLGLALAMLGVRLRRG
ncbi:hypothetical protein [Streptomyces sp. S.PB5]|uniref:hypothetical protein n=1 Tax=Streptomyces sp. S.PB5 TaxID=3020844 RepID=UPI0025B24A78|nr:hypothetical protein [Streptomyces sp. S.PB5]MDN3023644.1 hypothetical protein [Streptomyces sp. S.PB5]